MRIVVGLHLHTRTSQGCLDASSSSCLPPPPLPLSSLCGLKLTEVGWRQTVASLLSEGVLVCVIFFPPPTMSPLVARLLLLVCLALPLYGVEKVRNRGYRKDPDAEKVRERTDDYLRCS